MARPVFAHELSDPDFAWLVTTYTEEHPGVLVIENPGMPVTLLNIGSLAPDNFIPQEAVVVPEDETESEETKKDSH